MIEYSGAFLAPVVKPRVSTLLLFCANKWFGCQDPEFLKMGLEYGIEDLDERITRLVVRTNKPFRLAIGSASMTR